MTMRIEQLSYGDLPAWAKALAVAFPDNGDGRENANYLIVYENEEFSQMFRCYGAGRRNRDLSWVADAIIEAYEAGKNSK